MIQKRLPKKSGQGRAGFTLIETMIAGSLFVGIGYVLIMSSRASERSHQTVAMNVESNGTLREITQRLRDELRAARLESVALDQPAGGNATLRF